MKYIYFLIAFILISFTVNSHEGHHHAETSFQEPQIMENNNWVDNPSSENWVMSVGRYHLLLLHFPLVLINMAVIAQVLSLWLKKSIFDYAAQFNLYSAAFFVIPTVILGFIYSYSAPYEGFSHLLLTWHMALGIVTAITAFFVAGIRYTTGNEYFYYTGMVLLFLLVNTTAYFGAKMAYG